jgi:Protein of unknown function (DUF3592)
MRKLAVGGTVLAVLIALGLLAHRTPSQTLGPLLLLAVALAIGAAYAAHLFIRQSRLQNWSRAAARIENCLRGPVDEGSQEYTCTYVYSVNGTRQVGSFKFLDRPGRIEEIKAALVGEVISVMYDPRDCTKSIVEESRIKRWEVSDRADAPRSLL